MCLWHSNWTICSLLNLFCSGNCPSFSLSNWEANSYYPRGPIMGYGNSPNFKIGWDSGSSVPWTFNLAHLHPFKPLLFPKFSNFFTFILGGQFLFPQRANNEKREFTWLKNWIRQGGLCARAIQSGPFASLWATFVVENFQFFHFHTGRANSYYPRGLIMGKGNSPNFKIEWDRGFSVPGAFKLDLLQPFEQI